MASGPTWVLGVCCKGQTPEPNTSQYPTTSRHFSDVWSPSPLKCWSQIPRELVKNRVRNRWELWSTIPEFLTWQVKRKGPEILHFQQFPKWCRHCCAGDHTLRSTVLQEDTQPPLQDNTFPIGKKHQGRVKIEEKTLVFSLFPEQASGSHLMRWTVGFMEHVLSQTLRWALPHLD